MLFRDLVTRQLNLEITLEKLLKVVIENAGAQRCCLILEKNRQWVIEAESTSDNLIFLQALALDGQVPVTLIDYVVHTKKSVVLMDALKEGQFTRDPYILAHDIHSVLCFPLLNQGQLLGLLYLENNLTKGAFTADRLEILNLLSSQIVISIENARFYSHADRFVPKEFLSLLDKKSFVDTKLGDQVEKEMTVLFSDLRGFTTLSETMTPKQNFDFINAYLSQMDPVIHQHHGFIDKYIGDAIMALFPRCADDAVAGSIAMLKRLAEYNQERSGLPPIAIGIGLNTGLLMLGMVGGKNRMEGTVIADAVNLASRMEGITKIYGAKLLISERTYSSLRDPSHYAIRPVDIVKVKGRDQAPVKIYEVFAGDNPEIMELKQQTLAIFKAGLAYYYQKDFAHAKACFQKMLTTFKADVVAQIYLERCERYQQGVPENWDGVEVLKSK